MQDIEVTEEEMRESLNRWSLGQCTEDKNFFNVACFGPIRSI